MSTVEKSKGRLTLSFDAARLKKKKEFLSGDYEKQQEMIEALRKTSGSLAVETDINLILSRMAETLLKTLDAKYVNFWELTPDKQSLYITAAAGMQPEYIEYSKNHPIKTGTMWVGRAVASGKAWASSDLQVDPNLPPDWLPVVKKQDYHGIVCLPLMGKNEAIGGMCIYYQDIHDFDYFEMALVSTVANQASTAVANARLFGELLAERNKTLAIIQSLKDGLIMYDLEGKIVFFNPKAQELLWLREEDVVGRVIDKEMSQKSVFLKNLYSIKNLSQSDFESKEYATEGPQKVVLEVTYVPVRDQYKKIGAMQILCDISKEKEVELLKSNFVSIASHQLRTPLSAIKWGLDLFLRGNFGKLNVEQKDLAEKIFNSNERLINLVSDILDVSRIEEGRFGYDFALGSLEDLVEGVYKELKPAALIHRVEFIFEKPDLALPQVMFDGKKLDIAIRNVFDNAIKYTLAKGVIKVKFQVGHGGKFLFLKIEDNGIGIPEKDQKFIFVKFFRARNAIKYETEGSGLGLYIAKKIAEKHNAALFFESQENMGSSFVFQFPLEPERMPKTLGVYQVEAEK